MLFDRSTSQLLGRVVLDGLMTMLMASADLFSAANDWHLSVWSSDSNLKGRRVKLLQWDPSHQKIFTDGYLLEDCISGSDCAMHHMPVTGVLWPNYPTQPMWPANLKARPAPQLTTARQRPIYAVREVSSSRCPVVGSSCSRIIFNNMSSISRHSDCLSHRLLWMTCQSHLLLPAYHERLSDLRFASFLDGNCSRAELPFHTVLSRSCLYDIRVCSTRSTMLLRL